MDYFDSDVTVYLLFWILCSVFKTGRLSFHIRDIQTICNHFGQIQLWPSGQIEAQIRSCGVTNKITKVRSLPCFFSSLVCVWREM